MNSAVAEVALYIVVIAVEEEFVVGRWAVGHL
jgi:hypothetical protein